MVDIYLVEYAIAIHIDGIVASLLTKNGDDEGHRSAFPMLIVEHPDLLLIFRLFYRLMHLALQLF
jgi:hypothetical protein